MIFIIREKFRDPVKLGEGGITAGKIANKAFLRGIEALKKFKKIILARGVGKIFAFATSAIRSASNGQDFITAAKEETAIDIQIINGNEEAALIFEGVKSGVAMPFYENCLIVDIGGGSVEFIVTYENKAQLLRSVDIGAARMLEIIQPHDPPTKEQVNRTVDYFQEELKGLLKELKEFNIKMVVGSSGSFETLGAMIAYKNGDVLAAGNLNGYKFSANNFSTVFKRISKLKSRERMKVPGMDSTRVDMIIMGSILVNLLLTELDIKEVMISNYALKEGILSRFIQEKHERIRHLMGPTEKTIRAKAIRNFGKKFVQDEKHGLKVSEIATSIFDQLKPYHNLGEWEREILKYASLLHDIGHFLNRSGHHKHGQYLIMNSSLSGFSNDELIVLGNVVRYHRKSLPSRDHFHFKVMPQEQRNTIRTLAGILRVADNLDRGHRNLVKGVNLTFNAKAITINVLADQVVDIEVSAANEAKELMEQAYSRKVNVQQVSKP